MSDRILIRLPIYRPRRMHLQGTGRSINEWDSEQTWRRHSGGAYPQGTRSLFAIDVHSAVTPPGASGGAHGALRIQLRWSARVCVMRENRIRILIGLIFGEPCVVNDFFVREVVVRNIRIIRR
ncbi:hypothetical protein Mapa_016740 [Marchantia paleacea]|nr:hypothetical protein Mapa_016740 [Marchantia paleacea]